MRPILFLPYPKAPLCFFFNEFYGISITKHSNTLYILTYNQSAFFVKGVFPQGVNSLKIQCQIKALPTLFLPNKSHVLKNTIFSTHRNLQIKVNKEKRMVEINDLSEFSCGHLQKKGILFS